MALVVEDGIGRSDARSYASVAYLVAYAKARGITLPDGLPDKEIMLVTGWDAMLGLDYKGERATRDQAGDFPRFDICVDGFAYASTELPPLLLDGQCALAVASRTTDLQPTFAPNATGAVIEKTVGPITTRYADAGRGNTTPIVVKANAFLRKLLRSGGGTSSIRVERA